MKGCRIVVTKARHATVAELAPVFGGHKAGSTSADKVAAFFHEKVAEILPKDFLIITENGLRIWHVGSTTPIPELAVQSEDLRPQVAIVQVPPRLEESIGLENVKAIDPNGVRPSLILPHHHDRVFQDLPEAGINLFTRRVAQAFPLLKVLSARRGQMGLHPEDDGEPRELGFRI